MAVDTEYARWILLGTRGSLSYGVGPITSGALNIDIIGCRPRRADAPEHEVFCISGMPVGGGYSPLPFTIAESAAEENPGELSNPVIRHGDRYLRAIDFAGYGMVMGAEAARKRGHSLTRVLFRIGTHDRLNHVLRSLALGAGVGGLLIHDFNALAHRAAKASVTFTGAIHGTSLGVSLSTVTFTRPRSREHGTYAMSSAVRTEAERLVAAQ